MDNSINGTLNQNFRLTNSKTNGKAVIQITDLTLGALDPAAISEIWIQSALSSCNGGLQ